MELSSTEQLLLETVETLLGGKTALGLSAHKNLQQDSSHSAQHLHENIDQQFILDVMDLVHHQGITAAFKKVHDFRAIDASTFALDFRKEMTAQGIPMTEIEKALEIANTIRNKISKGPGKPVHEPDSGWHPDLDEVLAAAQPGQ